MIIDLQKILFWENGILVDNSKNLENTPVIKIAVENWTLTDRKSFVSYRKFKTNLNCFSQVNVY